LVRLASFGTLKVSLFVEKQNIFNTLFMKQFFYFCHKRVFLFKYMKLFNNFINNLCSKII